MLCGHHMFSSQHNPSHFTSVISVFVENLECGRNCTAGSSARQSAMHERYPGLNLFNSRHTAQLDRRCPRITPPTRHLTRADLARRSATILASEPPPEVIIGLVTSFQRLRSTSGVPKAPRPQLYGRRTQEPLPGAQKHLHVPFQGTSRFKQGKVTRG